MAVVKVTTFGMKFKIIGFFILLMIDMFMSTFIEPTFSGTLGQGVENALFFIIIA